MSTKWFVFTSSTIFLVYESRITLIFKWMPKQNMSNENMFSEEDYIESQSHSCSVIVCVVIVMIFIMTLIYFIDTKKLFQSIRRNFSRKRGTKCLCISCAQINKLNITFKWNWLALVNWSVCSCVVGRHESILWHSSTHWAFPNRCQC